MIIGKSGPKTILRMGYMLAYIQGTVAKLF